MWGREHVVDKDGASIPDEEWERFLRTAEAGGDDAPKEPSARARMVARRLREEPDRPTGWRTYQQQPARQRRFRGRHLAVLLGAAVLLVAALAGGRMIGWFGGDGDETPLAAESEQPGGPPATDAAALRPTRKEPFRGSPAARWDEGTAGIHMPAARATGWMSKEEVSRALADSRDFLAASSLDTGVLRGRYPHKAVAFINPQQPDVQSYLKTAFSEPSRKNDPLMLFSRFAKTKVRLVGDVVKTRGRITYREGERGAVEVTADVTFVYPVARADAGSDEVARTIVRREIVMSWDDPERVRTEQGTFSLVSYRADTTNGGCGPRTGYFVPEFGDERTDAPDGADVDPYDRSTSMDARMREAAGARCGTATRS
ncbi:hypothetical protein HMPREF1486_06398 [Streptomyces sp. HPH0547]|nr:hypothetical protein HMPREF1486_06398 [Streptomyces sp. HPH0547]